MKKCISIILALSLLCTIGAAFAEGPGAGRGGNGGPGGRQGGMRGGNGGGNDKSSDTELQTMIAEVAPSSSCFLMKTPKPAPACNISCIVPKTMMRPRAIR